MTSDKSNTDNESGKFKETLQTLIEGGFLGTVDHDFREFIANMPDSHWSKYDLSAVRLGWEAYKLLRTDHGNKQ